jgi:hypothetical protein
LALTAFAPVLAGRTLLLPAAGRDFAAWPFAVVLSLRRAGQEEEGAEPEGVPPGMGQPHAVRPRRSIAHQRTS